MATDAGTVPRLKLVLPADRSAADPPPPFSPAEERAYREQLGRILRSGDFARPERLRSLLTYLVEETLAGRGDRLGGYRLGVEVFGRGDDFDPRADSLVRNHAGRLRRALERYYLTEGAGDPVRIEVPRGSYRPRFSRRGPAAGTPEAGPREAGTREAEEPQIGTPAAGTPAAGDPILALPRGPAVAVVPFRNLSGDDREAYFAAGLCEELIVGLTRFQSLRVLGLHTSAWIGAYDGDPLAAGRELGVRYLLRGSVQRANGRARVAAHLADVVDGAELWAERYERALTPDNLLAVQDDIAARVSARLADAYGAVTEHQAREARRRGPRRMEAYDAVLRYHHCLMHLTPESFRVTGAALERAVAAEPATRARPTWRARSAGR